MTEFLLPRPARFTWQAGAAFVAVLTLCTHGRLGAADRKYQPVAPSAGQVQRATALISSAVAGGVSPKAEAVSATPAGAPTPAGRPRVVEAYGSLPLSFETNRGQTDGRVKFLSRGKGYTLYLTNDEAVLSLRKSEAKAEIAQSKFKSHEGRPVQGAPNNAPRATDAVIRMQLVGTAAGTSVSGEDKLPGTSNYFIGNDPAKWRTHIPTYAKVQYRNVYPGVDLVYYGNAGELEYDFVVLPGGDPSAIRMNFQRDDKIKVSAEGDLILLVDGGEIRFRKPLVYQTTGSASQRSQKQFLDARYRVRGKLVSFEIPSYDRTRSLVIDPTLSYSTYIGGSGTDNGFAIAVDSSGNAFLTGSTTSLDFPTTSGVFQTTNKGLQDVFVTKLNSTGTALLYSTYLGGTGDEAGLAIAVDNIGGAYITGQTNSTNFPTASTAVPFQTSLGGGTDAFVTKLSNDGTALEYSTYLGGNGNDSGNGIAVPDDGSGDVYLSGGTAANGTALNNFPTLNAFQSVYGGGTSSGTSNAFVTKLDSTGSTLIYSTYLGGSGNDIGYSVAVPINGNGNAYVTGQASSTNFPVTAGVVQPASGGMTDAFVAEINPAAAGTASLVYSTYLGGEGDDVARGIALDSAGNVYVTGQTSSAKFPTTSGVIQSSLKGTANAFVSKLPSGATSLAYSTYLGGSGTDIAHAIAVDTAGNAYVTGNTQSVDFPTLLPIQAVCASTTNVTCDDAFVAEIDASASALVYSTYLGGGQHDEGDGIALDSSANAYVGGFTSSIDFPTTPGAFQVSCKTSSAGACANTFVVKINPAAATIELSPAVVPFGTEAVGIATAAQTITLTNNSSSTLTITSIAASGDFAVATTGTTCSTGAPVAAASSCTIAVTFTPTTSGVQTGALTVSDSDSSSPQTAELSGTGVSVSATVSPTSLTFGSQTVGTTSSAQTVTVTNTGGATLMINSIAVTAGFIIATGPGTTCVANSTLAGGSSCLIAVQFMPTTPTAFTGTLTISDNASNSPQTVSLTGTGVGPAATVTPTSLTFPSQNVGTTSASMPVTLMNGGNASLSITSASIPLPSGQTKNDFAIQSNNCGSNLGVGNSCTIAVTFTPQASGPRAASLTISDNASNSPQTVALSGMGADFTISASPTSASISPGQSATYTISITPIGGFNSAVTLTCAGAPSLSACALSPASVTANGSTAAMTTLTVSTTAPASTLPKLPHSPAGPTALPGWVGILILTGLLALARPSGRRRAGLALSATMLLLLLWGACSPPNRATQGGTPPGNSTINITATSASLAHSTTVSLTVQ